MLISSAFLSSAAWRTDQLQNPSAIETPKSSHAPQHTEQQKPVETQGHEGEAHAAHSNGPEATKKEDNPPSKVHRQHNRRVTGKSHEEAQHAVAAPQGDAQPAGQDHPEPATPFRAILGDVLPKELAPAVAQDAGRATDEATGPAPKLPSTMGLPGTAAPQAAATEAVAVKVADVVPSQAPVKAEPEPQVNARLDPSFEIAKEPLTAKPTASAGQTAANPKTAERGEMAFVARISERPVQPAALTLRDAEAVIAASRFDASGAGGKSGGHDSGSHAATTPDPLNEANASPDGDQQFMPVNNQPDGKTSPQAAAVAESGTERAGIAPGGWRAPASGANTAPTIAAMPAAEVRAAATAQNAIPGMPAAASASTAPANARGPEGKNPTSEGGAPQFIEPQNEEHATESVRDISLRLTSKDQAPVQVRLSERAGELHVSVRTPDTGLTRGLRDGLTELVGRLENSGYRAETWQPTGSGGSTAHDQSHDSSRGGGQHQNAGGSGSGTGQQQNARDQQQPDGQTPKWLSELESNFQRSDKTWLPSATR